MVRNLGFMKQDIRFEMIFLIGLIIGAAFLLTLYYIHSLGNVNVDYNTLEDELEATNQNLTLTSGALDECKVYSLNLSKELNETQKIEEKSREQYNEIYEQTEEELTETQEGLKTTKDQLDKTNSELKETVVKLNNKIAALNDAENQISYLDREVSKLEKKEKELNNLEDDMETCKTNNDLDCFLGLVS